MRIFAYLPAVALLLVAGCASVARVDAPTVSIINSLSFDHAMSGKRDGLRSAWPMEQLSQTSEHFPLAQIKQCDQGGACSWGVLDASRTFGTVRAAPGGVAIALELTVDVERSQKVRSKEENGSMTIPANIAALQLTRTIKRELMLEYGKVQRIDLEHGVSYELCALRLDAARKALDTCAINFF